MKSINEVINKQPTEYVKPKKQNNVEVGYWKKIQLGLYDYLRDIDKIIYDSQAEICKNCKGMDTCKQDNKYHVPVIAVGDSKQLLLYHKYCTKFNKVNSQGTKQGTYEIETPTIQYENEQSKIANRLFSNMKGYLFGETGTGKTTMMKMLASKYINNGKDVLIESAFNISKDVKNGFEKATLDKYQHVDILIIDDLFRENITSYKILDIMTPIIQYRVDNNKPLLITSNYNIAQIKNLILQAKVDETTADTMCSRIRMLGVYELQGEDHRADYKNKGMEDL